MSQATTQGGWVGRLLRVDLGTGQINQDPLDEATLKMYPGGTCLGAKILYDEVAPGVGWSDPGNRLFLGSGPLGGTALAGSGTFSAVTKGPMTEGAAAAQANGWFGACIKLAGYDAVVFQGKSDKLVYLYIQEDGSAEIRDASHLAGMTTWDTEVKIKQDHEKKEHDLSVVTIGPAGENMVRFACLVSDSGHVAAHGGIGAVMGSKNLKAVVVERAKGTVEVADPTEMKKIRKEIIDQASSDEVIFDTYHLGSSIAYDFNVKFGTLPIKNFTLSGKENFPEYPKFLGGKYRERYDLKRSLCWQCPQHHCHIVKFKEGPYEGFVGEEPEYEQMAGCSSQIGQTDIDAAIVLANEIDRLGMDNNEAGWVLGWVMECYEKGYLSKDDLDGLDMTWGNVEATKTMLNKIALREGIGDTLAEGVMRSARKLGGEAVNCAIHTMKGNTPRGHDHRQAWGEMFSTCVSNCAALEERPFLPNVYDPDVVVNAVSEEMGSMYFEDSMGICHFNMMIITWQTVGPASNWIMILKSLKAATGLDISPEEALKIGRRCTHLLRAFNIRHGIKAELDAPSPRYGSAPTSGQAEGISIMTHWDKMVKDYYKNMGWDVNTGIPLAETLKEFGLDHVAEDLRSVMS